jgi:hypothetical protein
MSDAENFRDHLSRALEWEEAHAGFDKAVAAVPPESRGLRPRGFEHSPWDLLEHLRRAQNDLLEFCAKADYKHTLTWPDDYWPADRVPSEQAWNASVDGYRKDRAALQALVRDTSVDLSSLVPTGTGNQTYLRAILLVIDHNAYHVGQLIAVRRALGIWNPA